MARPTSRPEKPYTIPEIVDRLYTHFVIEGNPRCVDPKNHYPRYDLTGCTVGCLLTAEDAEALMRIRLPNIIPGGFSVGTWYYSQVPALVEIWDAYFGRSLDTLNELCWLRYYHDYDFKRLKTHIERLREQFCVT